MDQRTATLVAHGLAAVGVVLPIALCETPPLVDLPKATAVVHVLYDLASEPALAESYQVAWGYTPYLGLELAAAPLAAVASPLTTVRIVLALSLLLTGLAPAVLHRALYGEVHPWPLLGWLLAYHHAVFWGFFNYVIAVPLIVLGFGAWMLSDRLHPAARAALLTPIAFGLMTVHLVAWGAYGLLLLGGLVPAVRDRDGSTVGWAAVPFAASFAAWRVLPAPEVPGYQLLKADELFEYGNLGERIRDLISPFNFDYLWSDIGITVFGGCLAYWAIRERTVQVHPMARWPLAFTAVGIFAMPHILLGAWGTLRLPVLLAAIAVATSRPAGASPRALKAIAVLAAVALGLRTSNLSYEFTRCEPVMAELRDALGEVGPAEAVVPVLGEGGHPECMRRPVFSHVAAYATVDNEAFSHQVLGYPTVFATERSRPMADLHSPLIPRVLDDAAMTVIEDHADYVLDVHFGEPVPDLSHLPVVRQADWFDLRRVPR